MTEQEMKRRTREFGLRAIKLVDALPPGRSADVVGRQLLRSATSIGANYRAACRAKSRAHMASKLADVEEEADESAHWIEMLVDASLIDARRAADILRKANEITAIVVGSIKTLRKSPIQIPNSKIQNASRSR